MNKLEPILHEVTFLNFPFLWNQVKRYKTYLILLPLLMASLGAFFIKTQFTIYRQYLNVKVTGEVMPGELSRNQLQLSYDELLASSMSYEFHTFLSKLIVENQHFKDMSFNSLRAKSLRSWQDDFGACHREKTCEVEKLSGLIGQFIDVKKGASGERYTFELSSLDAHTLKVLTPIFINAVEMFRVTSVQSLYRKHEKLIQEMIAKSHNEMAQQGGVDALNQFKNNELKLQEIKEKISSLQSTINVDTSTLATMEFKLKETHSLAKGMNVGVSERLMAEKLRRKQAKINDLRQNIAALNSLAEGDRSRSDEIVLGHIQKELKEVEQEVQTISSSTVNFSEKESFNSIQQSNKNNLRFEYNVLRNKLKQEKLELDALMQEAPRIIEENSILTNKTAGLTQEMETIKQLNSRLLTIRLMIATAESDIHFEGYGEGLDEFNRSSKTQNLIFSFIISFIIVFIVLVVRYLFDDRIYEEHELKKCFKDLPIIGKTPDFD